MSESELLTMQREWRESTTEAIHDTATKVDMILSQISDIRRETATSAQLNAVSQRVTGLENDRQKIIGAACVLNLIGAFVLYIVTKFWK